jgi:hypothetical protein
MYLRAISLSMMGVVGASVLPNDAYCSRVPELFICVISDQQSRTVSAEVRLNLISDQRLRVISAKEGFRV